MSLVIHGLGSSGNSTPSSFQFRPSCSLSTASAPKNQVAALMAVAKPQTCRRISPLSSFGALRFPEQRFIICLVEERLDVLDP